MGFGKGAGIALYASLLNIFPKQAPRWTEGPSFCHSKEFWNLSISAHYQRFQLGMGSTSMARYGQYQYGHTLFWGDPSPVIRDALGLAPPGVCHGPLQPSSQKSVGLSRWYLWGRSRCEVLSSSSHPSWLKRWRLGVGRVGRVGRRQAQLQWIQSCARPCACLVLARWRSSPCGAIATGRHLEPTDSCWHKHWRRPRMCTARGSLRRFGCANVKSWIGREGFLSWLGDASTKTCKARHSARCGPFLWQQEPLGLGDLHPSAQNPRLFSHVFPGFPWKVIHHDTLWRS